MKKFISLLLIFCVIIPMFSGFTISAVNETMDGFIFDGDEWYYADGTLSEPPRTIEAWIYVDPDYATKTKTIISNYNGYSGFAYWHLAVKYESSYGLFPYLEWNELYDTKTSSRQFNFRNTTIVPGEWTHIAICIDAENNYVSCYKNGKHIQDNGGYIELCDIAPNVTELPLCIGADCRPGATGTDAFRSFHGKIASVSLFDDVRTATEISSDFSNGADILDENALAHWDFSSNGGNVYDAVGNVDMMYSKYWLDESDMNKIRGNDFEP